LLLVAPPVPDDRKSHLILNWIDSWIKEIAWLSGIYEHASRVYAKPGTTDSG
jgi:hypothetical protein